MAKLKRWFNLSALTSRQKIVAVVIILTVIIVATTGVSSTGNNNSYTSSGNTTNSTTASKSKGEQSTKSSQPAKSSSDARQSQVTQSQAVQAQSQEPTPRYYLVSTYGQGGRTYVIDSADATEDKLTLIGKDLNKLFGSDDMARIGIYTDPQQAQIGVDSTQVAALQGEADKAYDNAYVAQLNINKSTNLKQFFVYLNGSTKEVKL